MTRIRDFITDRRYRINKWLDEGTTRRESLSPWLGVVVTIVVCVGLFDYQSEARAYDACVARVQGRDDVRTVLTGMITELSDNEDESAGLIVLLNTVLEQLNVNEQCVSPTFY